MFIFPIIIIISIVLYVYYKVAILKTKDGLVQAYFNSNALICLGSLIFSFGIQQYLVYQTQLSLFIGIIFLILGGLQFSSGLKQRKHYRKEWKRLNPKTAKK